MVNTIAAVMRHVRCFFERPCIEGEITVTGGVVEPAVTAPYVYISGSNALDGLHKVVGGALEGVTASDAFTGRLWPCHPPGDFLALCQRIDAFRTAQPVTGLLSESLGEYSYTRAAGAHGAVTWQECFGDELRPYRRMFTEVG